jgi:hypothetical protein
LGNQVEEEEDEVARGQFALRGVGLLAIEVRIPGSIRLAWRVHGDPPLQRSGKANLFVAIMSQTAAGGKPQGIKLLDFSDRLLATWRPAGGKIRVVIVKEAKGWVAFFCTDGEASVQDILEAAADRNALEQTFKDVKEVWGAGQQQLRNIDANVGAFNLNGWMYSVVEAWAWERWEEELVDRSESPWDEEPRRPSHADRRKALQRQLLRQEIEVVLAQPPDRQRFRKLAEKLLDLAA